jgi:uncharacterized membrane protein YdcZ (DUF606 family)
MEKDVTERAVAALWFGLVVGFVVFLVLLVVSALLPKVQIDAGWWGLAAGLVAGLFTFLKGRSAV